MKKPKQKRKMYLSTYTNVQKLRGTIISNTSSERYLVWNADALSRMKVLKVVDIGVELLRNITLKIPLHDKVLQQNLGATKKINLSS